MIVVSGSFGISGRVVSSFALYFLTKYLIRKAGSESDDSEPAFAVIQYFQIFNLAGSALLHQRLLHLAFCFQSAHIAKPAGVAVLVIKLDKLHRQRGQGTSFHLDDRFVKLGIHIQDFFDVEKLS